MDAEAKYRKALALSQKLGDDDPKRHPASKADRRARWANSATSLRSKRAGKRSPSAMIRTVIAMLQKAVAATLRLDRPPIPSLADVRMNFGNGLAEEGKRSEAVHSSGCGDQRCGRSLTDDNPAVTRFRIGLAASHMNLGDALGDGQAVRAGARDSARRLPSWKAWREQNPAVTEIRTAEAGSLLATSATHGGRGQASGGGMRDRSALGSLQKLADENPEALELRPGPVEGYPAERPRRRDVGPRGSEPEAEAEQPQGARDRPEAGRRQPEATSYTAAAWRGGPTAPGRGGRARPTAEARGGFDRARRSPRAVRSTRTRRDADTARYLAPPLARARAVLLRPARPAGAAADARRALNLLGGLPSASGEQWSRRPAQRGARRPGRSGR